MTRDMAVVRRRVVNTLMLYGKQKRLMQLVADQIYENEKSNSLMITILSHIVEFRNGESGLHVLHIRTFTEMILRKLITMTDKYPLTETEISPARHRQDQHSRNHPEQARQAHAGRVRDHEDPHHHR